MKLEPRCGPSHVSCFILLHALAPVKKFGTAVPLVIGSTFVCLVQSAQGANTEPSADGSQRSGSVVETQVWKNQALELKALASLRQLVDSVEEHQRLVGKPEDLTRSILSPIEFRSLSQRSYLELINLLVYRPRNPYNPVHEEVASFLANSAGKRWLTDESLAALVRTTRFQPTEALAIKSVVAAAQAGQRRLGEKTLGEVFNSLERTDEAPHLAPDHLPSIEEKLIMSMEKNQIFENSDFKQRLKTWIETKQFGRLQQVLIAQPALLAELGDSFTLIPSLQRETLIASRESALRQAQTALPSGLLRPMPSRESIASEVLTYAAAAGSAETRATLALAASLLRDGKSISSSPNLGHKLTDILAMGVATNNEADLIQVADLIRRAKSADTLIRHTLFSALASGGSGSPIFHQLCIDLIDEPDVSLSRSAISTLLPLALGESERSLLNKKLSGEMRTTPQPLSSGDMVQLKRKAMTLIPCHGNFRELK